MNFYPFWTLIPYFFSILLELLRNLQIEVEQLLFHHIWIPAVNIVGIKFGNNEKQTK